MAQEALIVSAPLSEMSSVELSDTVGYVLQESSIVGNEDDGTLEIRQLFL